jgi:hypothetical protein
MEPNDQSEKSATHGTPSGMADPEDPAAQARGPGGIADQLAIKELSEVGINPQNTGSMSRGEDDEVANVRSPEFHDRPGQGNKK